MKNAGTSAMTPRFLSLQKSIGETADVITMELQAGDAGSVPAAFKPGQFNMLYAYGVGEIPVSISGDPSETSGYVHTIRAVGPVSEALSRLTENDPVGVRGPFGNSWPVDEAVGKDVLIIAGGIGLAPLRPALYHLIGQRERYGRIALLYGAREPQDLLYRSDLAAWEQKRDLQISITVDRAGRDWNGNVGIVTKLLPSVQVNMANTIAMICGPEVMIRFTASALQDMGLTPDRIFVSLERNMKCAIGSCGHCQFGPHFLCKDGPIFRYDRIENIMSVREI